LLERNLKAIGYNPRSAPLGKSAGLEEKPMGIDVFGSDTDNAIW